MRSHSTEKHSVYSLLRGLSLIVVPHDAEPPPGSYENIIRVYPCVLVHPWLKNIFSWQENKISLKLHTEFLSKGQNDDDHQYKIENQPVGSDTGKGYTLTGILNINIFQGIRFCQ